MRDRIKGHRSDVLRVAKAYLKESNRTLATFIPTKAPDRAEIPAAPDVAAMLKDYKGGAAVDAGRSLRSQPRQHRIARAAQQAAERHEDVAALAQDSRRHGRRQPHDALRR